PSMYDPEYDVFLQSVKTAIFFNEWVEEKDDDFMLEQYNVTPGESRAKLDIADWLVYASIELCRVLGFREIIKELNKTRLRLKHGAKEELLPLLRLKGIGRVRARRMYNNKIRDLGEVKEVDYVKLAQIIGKKVALDVKKQVGQDFSKVKVKENKRKGQISLNDY
ncbi:MAG: hypothetical protein DRJ64_06390, partial [Thermoprotei archaeon]